MTWTAGEKLTEHSFKGRGLIILDPSNNILSQKKKRIAGFISLWLTYWTITLSTDYGMYKAQISSGDWNVSDVFINQVKGHVNENISPHGQYLVWPTGLDNCCAPSTHWLYNYLHSTLWYFSPSILQCLSKLMKRLRLQLTLSLSPTKIIPIMLNRVQI